MIASPEKFDTWSLLPPPNKATLCARGPRILVTPTAVAHQYATTCNAKGPPMMKKKTIATMSLVLACLIGATAAVAADAPAP